MRRIHVGQSPCAILAAAGSRVLDRVSGHFAPGKLHAVLGASGSGKSSLMSVLWGRSDPGAVERFTPPGQAACGPGVVRVNGRVGYLRRLKSMAAFVPQDDVLPLGVTVDEALRQAALLKGDPSEPASILLQDRITQVERLLGVFPKRHAPVGSVEKRGVSGGERKRCSVGMELVARESAHAGTVGLRMRCSSCATSAVFNVDDAHATAGPALLAADEPSSGLDASTAFKLMTAFKRLASDCGVNVIAALHQPRAQIFDLFDTVTLMASGRVVFQGPREAAVQHFVAQGFTRDLRVNDPDYLLDVLSGTVARSAKLQKPVAVAQLPVAASSTQRDSRPLPDLPQQTAMAGVTTAVRSVANPFHPLYNGEASIRDASGSTDDPHAYRLHLVASQARGDVVGPPADSDSVLTGTTAPASDVGIAVSSADAIQPQRTARKAAPPPPSRPPRIMISSPPPVTQLPHGARVQAQQVAAPAAAAAPAEGVLTGSPSSARSHTALLQGGGSAHVPAASPGLARGPPARSGAGVEMLAAPSFFRRLSAALAGGESEEPAPAAAQLARHPRRARRVAAARIYAGAAALLAATRSVPWNLLFSALAGFTFAYSCAIHREQQPARSGGDPLPASVAAQFPATGGGYAAGTNATFPGAVFTGCALVLVAEAAFRLALAGITALAARIIRRRAGRMVAAHAAQREQQQRLSVYRFDGIDVGDPARHNTAPAALVGRNGCSDMTHAVGLAADGIMIGCLLPAVGLIHAPTGAYAMSFAALLRLLQWGHNIAASMRAASRNRAAFGSAAGQCASALPKTSPAVQSRMIAAPDRMSGGGSGASSSIGHDSASGSLRSRAGSTGGTAQQPRDSFAHRVHSMDTASLWAMVGGGRTRFDQQAMHAAAGAGASMYPVAGGATGGATTGYQPGIVGWCARTSSDVGTRIALACRSGADTVRNAAWDAWWATVGGINAARYVSGLQPIHTGRMRAAAAAAAAGGAPGTDDDLQAWPRRRTAGFVRQFGVFLWRATREQIMDARKSLLYCVALTGLGALAGVVFNSSYGPGDQPVFQMKLLICELCLALVAAASGMTALAGAWPTYYRDRGSGSSALAFFLARVVVHAVFTAVQPFFFMVAYMPLSHSFAAWPDMYASFAAMQWAASGIGMLAACIFARDSAIAMVCGIMLCAIPNTFLPRISYFRDTLRLGETGAAWAVGWSFLRWTAEALLVSELKGFPAGWRVVSRNALYDQSFSIDALPGDLRALLLIGVVVRGLGYLIMVAKNRHLQTCA